MSSTVTPSRYYITHTMEDIWHVVDTDSPALSQHTTSDAAQFRCDVLNGVVKPGAQEVLDLRNALEYAPATSTVAKDLLGWWTPAGFYVCAQCAGRIMARGCRLPVGSTPVWQDQQYGTCATCH